MKVERSYGEYNKDRYAHVRNAEQAPTKGNKSTNVSNPVKLSYTAQQIRSNQTVEQANSAKVDAIKKAIQEGTYNVSPKEISDSMWSTMKEQ